MVFKRLLAAAAAVVLCFSAFKLPTFGTAAVEEFISRDYHNFSGDQHYMDNYNSASSQHFQIFWGNDDRTGLVNERFIKLNLDKLEELRTLYTTKYSMTDSSESVFDPDGLHYKTNIYLTKTGLPDFKDGWAFMSAEPLTGFAYIYMDPAAMIQLDGTDSGSLAHEYGHVLTYHQKGWTNQAITDPWWETAANWFKEQYLQTLETPTTHFFLPYLRNMNLTIPHGRMYYEAWIFLQYLTENPDNIDGFGQEFMMRLQSEAEPNEYPFDTMERLTDCDLKEVIGSFAKRMATLDFKEKELYNENLQSSLKDQFVWQLIYTQPEKAPDTPNSYIVPDEKAPMQTGFNVIPLNIEGREVSVTLSGISDAEGADWRACLVAEGADGVTRYSPLFGEGTGSITLDGTETALYLTVAATPDKLVPNNAYDKAEESSSNLYNTSSYKRRYPYEIEISGATPMHRDIKAEVNGHAHPNGGGFVAETASVEDTVYVGRNAMVLGDSKVTGHAVITDNAVVYSANISDNAKLTDFACVYGFWWATPTVSGNAKIGDTAVVTANATVSGDARVMGNAYILDNYCVTDEATVKGSAYCYGNGVAWGQAIIDGDFANDCSLSKGAAFGWEESDVYTSNLTYKKDLFAAYEFDRESRIFAYDSYGATNGIMRNLPLWERRRSSASGVMTFNGKNQYIICDKTLADFKELEICTSILWHGGDDYQSVFEFGNDLKIRFTPRDREGRAMLTIGGATCYANNCVFPKGRWTIVRIVIKDNIVSLYFNGELVGQSLIFISPEEIVDNTSRFYIGRSENGNYFNGSMDYFRVYYHEAEEPEYAYSRGEWLYMEPTWYGDANCDGAVTMDDFDLILNSIVLPSKYGINGTDPGHITSQGMCNADVYERGEGITANDAVSIRKYLRGQISSLPES